MASGNIAHQSTRRPVVRPSVDELDRYLADHTLEQAARRWKVHPRTIQKWHARPKAPTNTAEKTSPEANTAQIFLPTADDIAGDHSMWRDPWTGELLPVPPGVRRKAWEAERIAARDRHKAAVQATYAPEAPTPDNALAVDTMSSQTDDTAPELTEVDAVEVDTHAPTTPHAHAAPLPNIALQSDKTPLMGAPLFTSLHTPTPERVITRIVRLPAETHQRGIYDRLAGIDTASFWGPELGAVVALLLILVTFWGLG